MAATNSSGLVRNTRPMASPHRKALRHGHAVDPPGEEDAHQPEEQTMRRRMAIRTDVLKDLRGP